MIFDLFLLRALFFMIFFSLTFYKINFHVSRGGPPPSPEGARGGDPPFRAQPGIKSTPKIAIAAEKKRE